MSRTDAIEILKRMPRDISGMGAEETEAIEMAIEALEFEEMAFRE